MVRFVTVSLAISLACVALAMPHDSQKEEVVQDSQLVILPPSVPSRDGKFFFSFSDLICLFRPGCFVPLPITVQPPAKEEEEDKEEDEGDDKEDDNEEDGEEKEEEEQADDEDADADEE